MRRPCFNQPYCPDFQSSGVRNESCKYMSESFSELFEQSLANQRIKPGQIPSM